MDFVKYVIFMIILLLSNTIQTITGFAGNMIAMPFSIHVVDISTAKCVLNVFSMIACAWIAIKCRKDIQWKILGKMTGIMMLGMIFASLVLERLNLDYLLIPYGIMIIIIALKKLFVKQKSNQSKLPQWLSIVIIFCAGIIHELFVSGGALLVVYAVTALPDKNEFRATVSCIWVVMDGILIFDHLYAGLYISINLMLITFSVIPLVISVIVGNWLYKKINQQMFLKITYVLLLIAGIVVFL